MIRTLTILSVLAVPLSAVGQGKLDAVREAVDRPHSSDNSKSDSTDDSSCPSTGSGDPGSTGSDGSGSDGIFLLVVAAPWAAPHALLDPGLKVDGAFTRYPFAAPDTGLVVLNREDGPRVGRPPYFERDDTEWYSVRAAAEVGNDFDGLTRVGLRLFLDTDTRFGIKTDWDYYSERLSCGCRDELWVGDVTATFRFVQNERIVMHTGFGGRFLLDHGEDRGGINFLYGFDAFPVRPWHVFGSVEVGTLSAATVWRVRGGVGANWTHAELFAGYDYLEIGGTALQGPFVGLRLWY
jgi:hypothetical protein